MSCGHGVAIWQANGITGCDRTLVDTRRVGANEVLGATGVGYAVGGFAGN